MVWSSWSHQWKIREQEMGFISWLPQSLSLHVPLFLFASPLCVLRRSNGHEAGERDARSDLRSVCEERKVSHLIIHRAQTGQDLIAMGLHCLMCTFPLVLIMRNHHCSTPPSPPTAAITPPLGKLQFSHSTETVAQAHGTVRTQWELLPPAVTHWGLSWSSGSSAWNVQRLFSRRITDVSQSRQTWGRTPCTIIVGNLSILRHFTQMLHLHLAFILILLILSQHWRTVDSRL